MPNGPRPLIDNACYHIITRGNNRQRIFKCIEDYEQYLHLIKSNKRKFKFKVFAYCLMPNHIHMIIEVTKSYSLHHLMKAIQRAYTAYFNSKYKLVGHLWQGRFKSKIMLKDKYLLDCVNYIELNPVRAKLVPSPSEYTWCSYRARALDYK